MSEIKTIKQPTLRDCSFLFDCCIIVLMLLFGGPALDGDFTTFSIILNSNQNLFRRIKQIPSRPILLIYYYRLIQDISWIVD